MSTGKKVVRSHITPLKNTGVLNAYCCSLRVDRGFPKTLSVFAQSPVLKQHARALARTVTATLTFRRAGWSSFPECARHTKKGCEKPETGNINDYLHSPGSWSLYYDSSCFFNIFFSTQTLLPCRGARRKENANNGWWTLLTGRSNNDLRADDAVLYYSISGFCLKTDGRD